jgi:hypothetical protein
MHFLALQPSPKLALLSYQHSSLIANDYGLFHYRKGFA